MGVDTREQKIQAKVYTLCDRPHNVSELEVLAGEIVDLETKIEELEDDIEQLRIDALG